MPLSREQSAPPRETTLAPAPDQRVALGAVYFSVITYNVLANAYLKPEWYAGVPPQVLEVTHRRSALLATVDAMDADIICLQEVEPEVYSAFETHLNAAGYVGRYAQKGRQRPDGSATFVRRSRFEIQHTEALYYSDGAHKGGDSGHVALVLHLDSERGRVGVGNTHLRWDPPSEPEETRWAIAEMSALLARVGREPDREWVLCGDFNVRPDNSVIALLQQAGFNYAFAGLDHHTCCANGRTAKLDYLFYSARLSARPIDMPDIEGTQHLPSWAHPSDHLPLGARFRPTDPAPSS